MARTKSEPTPAEDSQDLQPLGSYDTEGCKRMGYPYCEKCGSQFLHDIEGNPICPEPHIEAAGQCPRKPHVAEE